jgi:hypothetical protein
MLRIAKNKHLASKLWPTNEFRTLDLSKSKPLTALNLMLNCSPRLTVIKVKRNASIATEQATHLQSVEKANNKALWGGC